MAIPTFQEKQLATFTKVHIGLVGGAAPTIYGRIKDFQMPGRERSVVDVPELRPTDSGGNVLSSNVQETGDEVPTEGSFNHYWRPNHSQATLIDDAMTNNSELQFEIHTAHTDTPAKMEFKGKIKSISPAQWAKDEYYVREVTFIRTSDVTITNVGS